MFLRIHVGKHEQFIPHLLRQIRLVAEADELGEGFIETPEKINEATEKTKETLDEILLQLAGGGFIVGVFDKLYDTFEFLRRATGQEVEEISTRGIALTLAARKNRPGLEQYFRDLREYQARTGETGGAPKIITPFSTEVAENARKNAELLNSLLEEHENRLREALTKGTVSGKEFRDSLDVILKGTLIVNEIFTSLESTFGDVGDAYEYLTLVITNSSQEQLDYIIALKGEIASYYNQLNAPGIEVASARAIEESIKRTQNLLADYMQGLYDQLISERAVLPPLVSFEDIDADEFGLVLERAIQNQHEVIQEAIKNNLVPDGITEQDILSNYEDLFIKIGDGFYQVISGVSEAALNQAKQQLVEEELIRTETQPFDIRTIEASREQFLTAYQRAKSFITGAFPEYQIDEELMGIIFKNNITDVLHLDNLIIQLALQELIDVSKKQLDGIYNLPTDASFYVPFQGYKLGFGGGGAGGLGNTVSLSPETLAKIDAIADSMMQAALGILNLSKIASQAIPYGKGYGATQGQYREDLLERERRLTRQEIEKDMRGIPYEKGYGIGKKQQGVPGTFGNLGITPLPPGLRELDITVESVITKIQEFFKNLLSGFPTKYPQGMPYEQGYGATGGDTEQFNFIERLGEVFGQKIQNVSEGLTTNLKIQSTSNIQLIVDGRTLAQVIKPYFYADMLRFENTASSVTKSIVV